MSWATEPIANLRAGRTVSFRPRGRSMAGLVESGELCTVRPLAAGETLAVGAIVLCTVRGTDYLHLVKDVRGGRLLIGNNRGRLNGWIDRAEVYGRLVSVERW